MHDLEGKVRSPLDEVDEALLSDRRDPAVCPGDRGRAPRRLIDERHFAEHAPGANALENLSVLFDCDLTRYDCEHGVACVSLRENSLACAKVADIRLSKQKLEDRHVKARF